MTLIKISEFERLPEHRQKYLTKWKIDNFDLYKSKFGSKTLTELSLTNLMEISEMIPGQLPFMWTLIKSKYHDNRHH